MKHYIARRCGYSLLSLFLLSLTIFLFVRVTGDPTSLLLEPGASQQDIDNLRHQLGLDQPVIVQYVRFLADALRGDFGTSLVSNHPAFSDVLTAFPVTLQLTLTALALATAASSSELGRRSK